MALAEEIAIARASRRWIDGWLSRFRHRQIALPALVLQLDVLDRDRIGIGVKVRQSLIFGNPAAVHFVGYRDLARLIHQIDDDVLAKIFQRHFRTERVAQLPDLLSPHFEFDIVGDAPLQRDGFEFRTAGRLSARRRIAAFAMFDDFGRSFQQTYLADPGYVFAIP